MISIWIITIEEHKSRKRELDVTYLEVLVPYGPNDCLSGRVYTLLIGTDRGVPMPWTLTWMTGVFTKEHLNSPNFPPETTSEQVDKPDQQLTISPQIYHYN